jgi:hypothetical protein
MRNRFGTEADPEKEKVERGADSEGEQIRAKLDLGSIDPDK